MTEGKTFEPITSQQEFDERIKARLVREREKWEKESSGGAEDLQAQLAQKDKELARAQAKHDVDLELTRRGLDASGKSERIKKLLDYDAETPVTDQLQQLSRDVPELFSLPRGAGSRGSSKPVLQPQEKPLSREDVEGMSEQEINSNWDRVKAFMAGER
jgi:hypothetical protein